MKTEDSVSAPSTERLFVSSTFRNLSAERDELSKRVFPRLRELCEQRGVAWAEVDLRWGITDEQEAEGRVLPLCLEAIDRSTLFVGILGDDYYGWIPESIPAEVSQERPWLGGRIGSSITELEMVHALRAPTFEGRRFFYFRGGGGADDGSASGLRHLERLKDLIRSSGPVVHEQIATPRALAELVLADLEACLKARHPPSEELDPLDRERLFHESVILRHAQAYVERTRDVDRIEAHVRSSELPLAISGPSGVGKSALLSYWADGHRRRHPADLMIVHFVGASPRSAAWDQMVRRLIGELDRHHKTAVEIPEEPEPLRTAFARALSTTASEKRIVLVIDGLDQLIDREGALELSWLPPVLPTGVSVVTSTQPGPPLDELSRRGWPHLTLGPLGTAERRDLIRRYLALYAKGLSARHQERLIRHESTGNPLFLRTILEELRLHGEHRSLTQRLEAELEAKTLDQLFDRILDRYEDDYEQDRPGLVADSMSLLWAARRGLPETELLDLLGEGDRPLPSLFWMPMVFAAGASLVDRNGLIGFAHHAFARAVERRYLQEHDARARVREKLVSYFQVRYVSPRKVDELPWQLAALGDHRRLADLLSTPEFFKPAYKRDRFEIRRYWAWILEEDADALAAAFRPIVQEPGRYEDLVDEVELLLHSAGEREAAKRLMSFQLRMAEERGDKKELARCLSALGTYEKHEGDLEGAISCYVRSLSLWEELGDKRGIAAQLGQLSMELNRAGDHKAALDLGRRQELLARQLDEPLLLASALANQAIVHTSQRRWREAIRLRNAQAEIARRIGDPEMLGNALANLGELTPHAVAAERDVRQIPPGELAEAARVASLYLKEAREHAERNLCVALSRRVQGHQERLTSMFSELPAYWTAKGVEAFRRAELDVALELFETAEVLARAIGDEDALGISLGEQAIVLLEQGRLEPALELLREEERFCRSLGDDSGLQMCLGNQVAVLLAMDDLDAAAGVLEEQEGLCRQLGDTAGMARASGHRAEVALKQGDRPAALSWTRRYRDLAEEAGDEEVLATALLREAILVAESGDPRQAVSPAKRARSIARQRGWTMLATQADGLLRTLPRRKFFR